MTSGQSQFGSMVPQTSQALVSVMQFLKNKNLKETQEVLKRELGYANSDEGHQTSVTSASQSAIDPSKLKELYASSIVPSSATTLGHSMSISEPMNMEEEDEEEEEESPRSWPGTLPPRHFPTLNKTILQPIPSFPFNHPTQLISSSGLTKSHHTTPLLSSTSTASTSAVTTPLYSMLSNTPRPFVPTLFTIVPPGLIGAPILPPTTQSLLPHTFQRSTITSTANVAAPITTIDTDSTSESQSPPLSPPTKAPCDTSKAMLGKAIQTLASIPQEEMTPALTDLKAFAEDFKNRRIQLGYTQEAVGQSLAEKGYSNFAQSTISRFEQLQLSASNATTIRKVLERWLMETENPSAVVSSPLEPPLPARKRKRRAVFNNQTRQALDDYFQQDQRPNRSLIEMIAHDLDLLPEEVRVWFCNKRQKAKHYVSDDSAPPSPASSTTSKRSSASSPVHANFSIEELSKSSVNSASITTFTPIKFTSHFSMLTPHASISVFGGSSRQPGFSVTPSYVMAESN